jgi:hypothetical protein
MARKVCGACGARNELNAAVCSECGAALAGSRRPPRRADRADGKGGPGNALLDLFPGFTSGRTMVWAGIMLLAALSLGLHAYSYMRLHVAPAAIVAGIAAMAFYCTGMMWMLYGYVCVPLEAAVEFNGRRWLALIVLALVPVVAVLALAGG